MTMTTTKYFARINTNEPAALSLPDADGMIEAESIAAISATLAEIGFEGTLRVVNLAGFTVGWASAAHWGCDATETDTMTKTKTAHAAMTGISDELRLGIALYRKHIAALGGYGARIRARTRAEQSATLEGELVDRGDCQPALRTPEGRVFAIVLDSATRIGID
jgi:hypothetical protein